VCPTKDKKLAFICEKELTVMDETEGKETERSATDRRNT
jgi:hypothetical protein